MATVRYPKLIGSKPSKVIPKCNLRSKNLVCYYCVIT